MKLTFLGTGTSQGIPVISCHCDICASLDSRDKRLRTSVHIEQNNTSIVIDAGPDFRTQMLRAHIDRLDGVLLTHAHHDHVAGLDDVRSFNYSQKMPIPVYGDSQCIEHLKLLYDYAFGEYPGVPRFDMTRVEKQSFTVGNILIEPLPVLHGILPILGYKIDQLAYITDASSIYPETMEKIKNLDVLVLNALRKKEHHSHFSLQQALDVVELLKPKKTYLTHISHMMGKHSDCESELPENVFLAYDALSIELP